MFKICLLVVSFIFIDCDFVLHDDYLMCIKTEQLVELKNFKCNFADFQCQLFLNSMNDMKRADGHYVKLDNDMVFYSQDNQVYSTKCERIKSLVIKNFTIPENICLKILPVLSNDRQGFLTNDGIVINDYNGVPCPVSDETLVFESQQFTIKQGEYVSYNIYF
jgi:hypothetical protein